MRGKSEHSQSRGIAKRLARVITAFAAREGLTLEEVAARCSVSRPTIYNYAAAKKRPQIDTLRRICEATGVSADWLLGFDVPEARAARTPAGPLADALRREVLAQNAYAARFEAYGVTPQWANVADVPDAGLLAEIVRAFWRGRLEVEWRHTTRAIHALSREMTRDAAKRKHGPAADAIRSAADEMVRRIEREPAPELEWSDLWWWLVPTQLRVLPRPTGDGSVPPLTGYLRTTFRTHAGSKGMGFAYRGATHDHGWFLDATTHEPTYLGRGRWLEDADPSPTLGAARKPIVP